MRVRGTRECVSCGRRWSYYETGNVECPDCGSLRSRGVEDERRLHTDGAATLDLSAARDAAADDEPLRRVAERAAEAAADYVRQRGFVSGGELRTLDETYLAAAELRHLGAELSRAMRPDDEAEYHLLALLRAADDGERPPPAEVPGSLRAPRGLGYADAVDAYRADLRRYADDGADPAVADVLDALRDHDRRVEALEGDVDPRTAELLVEVARDAGRALSADDEREAESALARARDRLDRLADDGFG